METSVQKEKTRRPLTREEGFARIDAAFKGKKTLTLKELATVLEVKPEVIVAHSTPRLRLLAEKLSDGTTMRELFESWGFRFDGGGWLKLSSTTGK